MARYQYRISGELGWMSNSGNAVLAITNPPGSGKRLTIRSLEINPLGSSSTGTAGTASAAPSTAVTLARATVAGGIPVTPTRLDTNAAAWPSTVEITRRASVSSPLVIQRSFIAKQLNQASLSWLGRQQATGRLSALWKTPRRDSTVEGLTVRAGEGLALYCSTLQNAIPVRVSATLEILGSPNRSYQVRYYTAIIGQDEAAFAINNTAGSGQTVVLRNVSIEEVGTYDSPYFQLVPMGAILEGEATERLQVLKPDTAFPDPTAWLDVRQDVAFLPFGMPENALADSSTGSPKGFNYLKTKDFLGPVFRTVFPEYTIRPGNTGDLRPCGQAWQDIMARRAGITIREGEGVALVSGAETAAGATAAVGVSGWNPFEFAADIDVENAATPKLTLTGLKPGTEVRVFDAGTTTELAGAESIGTGTFEWFYDTDTVTAVDVVVLSLGYLNIRLPGLALGASDVSVPIQQQIDRQYLNP